VKNKTILLISPEPWGINFVSKHHYANYLAKNNTVYFLNPPKGFSLKPWKGIDCKIKPISENLIEVDYLNIMPRLNQLPKWLQSFFYRVQAKRIQQKIGIKKFDIIWSFDPYRFFDQRVWESEKTIYHTVDFHPKAKYEKSIILSSDCFLGVADLILEEHKAYRTGHLIPHAADIGGYQKIVEKKMPGNNNIKAIYTGNFHRHINYSLLKQLTHANPNCDFIMIGPTCGSNLASKNSIEQKDLKELQNTKNIYFIGSVPGAELMTYLNKGDINLVLFKKENERLHCSPHKLMAYFYSGNITLSNYIDAHKKTNSNIIKMVQTDAELLSSFSKIIDNLSTYNSCELKKARQNFAIENSYDKKINQISKLLYANAELKNG
jgi:glycosyltransferase involved in cell wall biosynthesis